MPYRVYVIELNDDCRDCRRRDASRSKCVYVGESWHTPEVRLRQHLYGEVGIEASRIVKRCGGTLRADLYAHLPALETREDARALEAKLAGDLREQGYVVFGGH